MSGLRLLVFLPVLVALGCAGTLPRLVSLPEGEAGTVFFESVRVFDGEKELSGPHDVLLRKGRIVFVGPAGTVPPPEGATRIEGKGRTLLPGLWDSHVHLGGGNGEVPWDARLPDLRRQLEGLVYSGVTSAVDAGHSVDTRKIDRRVHRRRLVGPHLVSFSRVFTKKNGHPIPLIKALLPWPVSAIGLSRSVREIDSPKEAFPAMARELKSTNTPWVKIVYNSIPPDAPRLDQLELRALIDSAHAAERRVGVHVGSPREAREAVLAGADLLMHTPWTLEISAPTLELLKEHGRPLITTRRIYSATDAALRGKLDFTELGRAVADPEKLRRLRPKPHGWREKVFSEEYLAKLPRWDRRLGQNILLLREAGVPLLVGTDSGIPGLWQGPALHRELESLSALGIPNEEILQLATSKPASFFEPKGRRGRIARGYLADLLLVEGNPLERISDTQKIVGVWLGGVLVDRHVSPQAPVSK